MRRDEPTPVPSGWRGWPSARRPEAHTVRYSVCHTAIPQVDHDFLAATPLLVRGDVDIMAGQALRLTEAIVGPLLELTQEFFA